MADIHGFLPEFDKDTNLLILAGDLEPNGGVTSEWIRKFHDWRRPDEVAMMAIPGNHDFYDGNLSLYIGNYQGITIWGSPITVGNPKGRRHVMSDEDAKKHYRKMPR
jgi:hypothetical protein